MSTNAARVGARLAEAKEACRLRLEDRPLADVLTRLGSLASPDRAFEFLSKLGYHADSFTELAQLSASIPSDPDRHCVEHALLILASQHAMEKIPALAVNHRVKALFCDEFEFFATPPAAFLARFQAHDVRYGEMARVATLRRYPAGQFQWEVAGFPRSWVPKARRPLQLLGHVLGRMRGFGPLFELHLNARRKNRLILVEKEADLSYYRAARAVEKQPAVRGLLLGSWLYCESTARITPRLAWLRRTPQSAGAQIFDVGPAPEDSGFLTGSEERRKLYEAGEYRPQLACALWPRKQLIEWANQHPELDD